MPFFPLTLLRACEELVKTLGFDWIMMFMEEHLHSSTVTAAMRILVVLLSNQSILIKFKEGLSGGGWLDQTDSVLTNKIGTVLGRHCSPWGLRDSWEHLCRAVGLWVIVWVLYGWGLSVALVCAAIRCFCTSSLLQARVKISWARGNGLTELPLADMTQMPL